MFGFDINQPLPGGLNTIDSLLASYSTPEAARSDFEANAPRGMDLLQSSYQGITGDWFADPFREAETARSRGLTNLAVTTPGISFTSNPNTGTTVNRDVMTALATSAAAETNRQNLAARQGLQTQFTHPDYYLGDVSETSPDFTDIQRNRVSTLGTESVSLFDKLRQEAPSALQPVDRTDPRLQLDSKGKPVAGDVLNSDLFSHPEFQKMLREDPKKADQLYYAITDRSLEQDLQMQRASNEKRQTERDKVLAEMAPKLNFDEVTGKPYLRDFISDPINPGQEKEVRRPLSEIQQRFIEQEGGFKGRFGFHPPSGMDVGTGVTQRAATALRTLVSQDTSSDPLPVKLARAKAQLRPAMAAPPSQEPGNLSRSLAGISNFMRSGVNVPINMINELLRSKGVVGQGEAGTTGYLPTFSPLDPSNLAAEYAGVPSIKDIYNESTAYYSNY